MNKRCKRQHPRRWRLPTLAMAALAAAALAPTGLAADWLVTRDGAVMEIDGPWQVEGSLVTFRLPNGTLGSLRTAAVDLDASRDLTDRRRAAATAPAAEPAAATRKAVMVLTDADVGHVGKAAAPAESQATATPEAAAPATSATGGLRVAGWRDEVDIAANSVAIFGTLQNPTRNPATSISLDVILYDEKGGLLEKRRARLEQPVLNPGASTGFEAAFEDTLSFSAVKFDIQSRGFRTREPDAESESSEGGSPPGR